MARLATTLLLVCSLTGLARGADDSWKWVHAGVAAQWAGNVADIKSSWGHPEKNGWLAANNGRFTAEGAGKKIAVGAGITAVSYFVAKKWPRTRKYVGVFNFSVGVTWGQQAVRNWRMPDGYHQGR
jgi:hypothetical protein